MLAVNDQLREQARKVTMNLRRQSRAALPLHFTEDRLKHIVCGYNRTIAIHHFTDRGVLLSIAKCSQQLVTR